MNNLIKQRAVSSSYLKNRINLNKKYQKFDFKKWQFIQYNKIITKFIKIKNIKKIKILDIGSGNGLQVSHFTKIFFQPEIWCLDYSKKSLVSLKKKYISKKIKAKKIDMDNLSNFIKKNNFFNYFDIVHSSYAFYYSKKQNTLLKEVKKSLKKNGLILISAPAEPHEMVNFIHKISPISKKIMNTLKFMEKKLIPFIKENCSKKIFIKKINYIKFNNSEEFIDFWSNTTYFKKSKQNKVLELLNKRKKLKFKKISAIVAGLIK